MKVAVGVLIAIFLFAGIGEWLHHAYVKGAANTTTLAAAVALPVKQITPAVGPVGTGVTNESGPFTIHGTAIMDTSVNPAVPYIQYVDASNHTATKQLIFDDTRGCSPGAGDIPCVPSYSVTAPYPHLTTGDPITVTGYIYENRFLITSITAG
ncbi:MAG: hypothetical protein JWL75_309 [Parcubacteria group bacterium]|nr:hypothetical protein [Parcubacteria group bacterium]